MSTGIDTYIFKVAAVCNLNCTYCYYYHGADTSFQGRPKYMSMDVLHETVNKIIKHTQEHNIRNVDLTLHGGEPLLIGHKHFIQIINEFDRIKQAGVSTRYKCQSNGVLLDQQWMDLLSDSGVLLGISLDGPHDVHDMFRVDHMGRGSYDLTVSGLKLALDYESKGLKTSVISVINPLYDGGEMYRHMRSLGIKKMDFLLPENNYAYPPQGYSPLGTQTPFGDFLINVFDAWMEEDDPEVTVRLLDRIIRSLLGEEQRSDTIGTAPVRVAVIETDGSIEPTDNFKACANHMTDLGLNIFENSFDDLYYHDFFKLCIEQANNVPFECISCDHVNICAGGRISTRYSFDNQFNNRTIYCKDLYKLYDHIESFIERINEHPVV